MALSQKKKDGSSMYAVMTNPVDLTEDDTMAGTSPSSRRGIRRRCALATLSLAVMLFVTYSMFGQADCSHGTTSGQPFKLVHQIPGRYGSSMMLATFATVTAMFYPIAVARRPRPHFLHVAGSYLIVNAVTMCSEVSTVWAGCAHAEWVRAPTALTSLIGLAVSFILLQYSILVKVEALDVDAQEEDLAKAPLRRAYHMMLNPYTIGFGLLSAVVPLGLVDGFLYNCIIAAQAFFLIIFLGVMLSFTALSIREMKGVLVELEHAELERSKKSKLKNHLAMHSFATMCANMTTILFFGSVAANVLCGLNYRVQQEMEAWVFFFYGVDILANTTCALTLSGLTGAVCRRDGGVVLLEENSVAEHGLHKHVPGPVEKLGEAGRAAQSYQDEERANLHDQQELADEAE